MGGRGSGGSKNGGGKANQKIEENFKQGDLIRIKPEFCDTPTEHTNVYVITEMDVSNFAKRCVIKPVTGPLSKMPIIPTNVVGLEMIQSTGVNVDKNSKK